MKEMNDERLTRLKTKAPKMVLLEAYVSDELCTS